MKGLQVLLLPPSGRAAFLPGQMGYLDQGALIQRRPKHGLLIGQVRLLRSERPPYSTEKEVTVCSLCLTLLG